MPQQFPNPQQVLNPQQLPYPQQQLNSHQLSQQLPSPNIGFIPFHQFENDSGVDVTANLQMSDQMPMLEPITPPPAPRKRRHDDHGERQATKRRCLVDVEPMDEFVYDFNDMDITTWKL